MEAAAHARDGLAGEAPSLAVLFASRSHTDKAVDVLNAVHQTVEPPALIGCVAQAIVAGRREFEDEAAVAVWLASGLAAETFQLDFIRTGSGGMLAGYRFDRSAHDLHVLLPDPYTFPSNLLVEHLNTNLPGTTVMGGVVSGGRGPGDTRLFRDRDVETTGVVGVRLPGRHGVPIVSQGCRPIGEPYIVTGADGAVITELGGRPPLQRLRELVEVLPPDEQELVSDGLQIGIVVDEHLAVPGQGDFMIRGLLGADPSTGAIEIGEVVEIGATVQFQVRDAGGADKDLRLAVERAYLPLLQGYQPSMTLVLHIVANRGAVAQSVRESVQRLNPDLAVTDVRTMREHLGFALFPARAGAALLGGAGLLGLGLTIVGLYGLLAFVVRQRSQEMGIRMALGAGPGDVIRLVLRRSLWICAWGIGLGFGLAWIASMVLARVLYGVNAHDAAVFAGAPLVILIVAIAATIGPALAAVRVDPMTALRQE